MIGLLKRTAKCRACGKEILLVKIMNGKTVPVDPEPEYFYEADETERYVTLNGEIKRGLKTRNADWAEEEYGYTDHRQTCEKAEDLKRKKNKSERVKEWSG